MKPLKFGCIVGLGLLAASCSSESVNEPNAGIGSVNFSVKSETSFANVGSSRAVNEDAYRNVSNYTVDIIGSDGEIAETFTYGDRTNSTIKLTNGNYTIKAYYGEESVASQKSFYVVGETNFTVNADDQSVTVDCKPTCGKVVVDFGSTMSTYFSDYYVTFETEALNEAGSTVTWDKTTTDAWYLKLNAKGETVKAVVHYTLASSGNSDSVELTNVMNPDEKWTMHIAPKDGSGGLSLDITIDEETNDRIINVPIDSSWIYGPGNVSNN